MQHVHISHPPPPGCLIGCCHCKPLWVELACSHTFATSPTYLPLSVGTPLSQVIPSLEMLSVVRSAVDAWSSLTNHPGLLVPLEGFVATELDGSPSLAVTTSYVPGAVTLAQAHLQPTQVRSVHVVVVEVVRLVPFTAGRGVQQCTACAPWQMRHVTSMQPLSGSHN